MVSSGAIRPIEWQPGVLSLLDQTKLPVEESWSRLRTVSDVAEAIRTMRVRGAPAIGIAAAAGMALAVRTARAEDVDYTEAAEQASRLLVATRPTAVNLRWAVERALDAMRGATDPCDAAQFLDDLVARMLDEQWVADRALSALGAALLPPKARVLTHCNTGPLATGGYGTALGVIRSADERGGIAVVYVDESRPRLQGARLTAWELTRLGVPFRVIVDSVAASLMARGAVDAIVVGADRIAANGDVANKIGTYQLAVVARHHDVPFYVAAPVSTIDATTATGRDITIEERDADEVRQVGRERVTPPGVEVFNPAFDVTPAGLISAIVTERGVLEPPFDVAISGLTGSHVTTHETVSETPPA